MVHFEDLPNEIIYEIFEFLDFFHVYQSFFDLNIRFRRLITSSKVPTKIIISSLSKSTLEHYYTDIVIPYQPQITLLCITNKLSFDLDISPHRILSKFIRLETLILGNLKAEYVEDVLKDCIHLSNLSSLVIAIRNIVIDVNHHLLQIFRLPAFEILQDILGTPARI